MLLSLAWKRIPELVSWLIFSCQVGYFPSRFSWSRRKRKKEFLTCILSNWWLTWFQLHYSCCRREVLHSYGFEHMFTLSNLEKAGLLTKQVCFSSSWKIVCRNITYQKMVKFYLLSIGLYWLIPSTFTFYTYELNIVFYYLQEVKSNWLAIKKGLKLVPEESDDVKWVLTLHCLDPVSV